MLSNAILEDKSECQDLVDFDEVMRAYTDDGFLATRASDSIEKVLQSTTNKYIVCLTQHKVHGAVIKNGAVRTAGCLDNHKSIWSSASVLVTLGLRSELRVLGKRVSRGEGPALPGEGQVCTLPRIAFKCSHAAI